MTANTCSCNRIRRRTSTDSQNKEENPLPAEGSHFAPQNKEENPLLAEGSHFAPQNKEDGNIGGRYFPVDLQ